MQNVRAYCTFDAMDEAAAQAQLTAGKVSAVLFIPDGFLSSIYSGENAAPTLLLDARRPLEGYLARWAGSCAISMLMDAQAGVTAVLDARAERKQAGAPLEKSKKKITQEINLRYIQQALGRSDLMRTETLSPTGALEPGDHYALSALSYLILLAGAVFFPLFDERARRGFLRRLQSAGGSLLPLRLSALTLCAGLSAHAAWRAACRACSGLFSVFRRPYRSGICIRSCRRLCRSLRMCGQHGVEPLSPFHRISYRGRRSAASRPAPRAAAHPAAV